MSLPVPLAVRLSTSRAQRHITAEVSDLWFRSTAPGGFASASVALSRPLHLRPDEIDYYGRMYVYDARSGQTVWEGRLEDPGRSGGRDGPIWNLAGIGPSAHTRDRTIPLIYVDRRADAWIKSRGASGERQSATVSAAEDAGGSGAAALVLSMPAGLAVNTSSACTAVYWPLDEAGQKMAVFDYRWDAGISSTLWRVQGLSGPTTVVRDEAASTSGGASNPQRIGVGAFPVGDRKPFMRLIWTGGASSTGTSDDVWASLMGVVVRATTYSRAGVEKTSGYTNSDTTILASTVVEDLLGRLLTEFDGVNASVATTTKAIEQLAYPEGVTAGAVLDDLMEQEPAYFWAAWESNTAGKYRFEWAPWPTTIRYEADITDGYDSTGSASELYNEVLVRWREASGRLRTTVRTQAVPALSAAGLTRSGYINLGDEAGSAAAANEAGDAFLANHAAALNAGRLVLSRPVFDRVARRAVMPWEVRPGTLIRVRGILPRVDSLNSTARDGVTVFRIVSVEYRASSAEATLELDSYSPSVARAIADAQRRASYGPGRPSRR
ncbi:hypothetical protein [Micromonospora marina]|uniref:hypothetical protein n=1 Tax=Micromonospora marina TaxID=307120 RepID=UPI003453FE3D